MEEAEEAEAEERWHQPVAQQVTSAVMAPTRTFETLRATHSNVFHFAGRDDLVTLLLERVPTSFARMMRRAR